MVKKILERRKNRRVFFTMKEGIVINLKIPGQSGDSISGTLLSIGGGGISFAIPRVRAQEIQEGSELLIQSIEGIADLKPVAKISALVRYIIDYDVYIYISFGCEFKNTNDTQKKAIKAYVDKRLKEIENQSL